MKNKLIISAFYLLGLSVDIFAAGTSASASVAYTNPYRDIPDAIYSELLSSGFFNNYDIFLEMEPHMQLGDYNGDGTLDIAMQIIEKSTQKRGIVFIHTNDLKIFVIGAGKSFGSHGDDFNWHRQWRKDSQALNEDKIIQSAEAVIIDTPDFSKCVIYFDGKTYQSNTIDSPHANVDIPVYGQNIPQLLLRIAGLNPI